MKNFSQSVSLVSAIVALTITCDAVHAAVITAAGSVVDNAGTQVTYWKTSSVSKTLDADGNNVYGSLADLMYTVRFKGAGTLFSFDGSDPQGSPFPGYASVDNPTGEVYPNTSHSLIQVGTAAATPGEGNSHDMFTFTVLTNATPNFRLGIVSDCLNDAAYSPTFTGLRQIGTGATASLASNTNNVADMNFFDVYGAKAGDQFAVWGVGSSSGWVSNSIVTWDAIIPEPASLGLLALGGLALLRRRR